MNVKWRLAYQGEVLVISSGLIYTQTTKPKSLKLEQVKQMINENPNSGYYKKGVKRRVTLGDGISRKSPQLIGQEAEFNVSISLIQPTHDRVFPKTPVTGKQLMSKQYRSKPIRINNGS